MTILPMTLSVTLPTIDKTQVLRTPEACFSGSPIFPLRRTTLILRACALPLSMRAPATLHRFC